jgi:thiamine-monophosphate kinase
VQTGSAGLGATLNTSIAINLLAARADIACATAPFDSEIANSLALQCVLAGGDDYELVFTAPPQARGQVHTASASSATPVTRIGSIQAQSGLHLVDGSGAPVHNGFASFDHFSE